MVLDELSKQRSQAASSLLTSDRSLLSRGSAKRKPLPDGVAYRPGSALGMLVTDAVDYQLERKRRVEAELKQSPVSLRRSSQLGAIDANLARQRRMSGISDVAQFRQAAEEIERDMRGRRHRHGPAGSRFYSHADRLDVFKEFREEGLPKKAIQYEPDDLKILKDAAIRFPPGALPGGAVAYAKPQREISKASEQLRDSLKHIWEKLPETRELLGSEFSSQKEQAAMALMSALGGGLTGDKDKPQSASGDSPGASPAGRGGLAERFRLIRRAVTEEHHDADSRTERVNSGDS